MGRPRRAADGGRIYHVLNRANAGITILSQPQDYAAFQRVLEESVQRTKTRLLAYCIISTHWQMVLWPQEDGELSRFTGSLTF
jgi:putative transposase